MNFILILRLLNVVQKLEGFTYMCSIYSKIYRLRSETQIRVLLCLIAEKYTPSKKCGITAHQSQLLSDLVIWTHGDKKATVGQPTSVEQNPCP